MRIVYGWNSFKIRSFSLIDLGIVRKEYFDISSIEVRQKYFHVFWIPFFSLGKKWVVRKDDQLYEMPADLQTLVKTSANTAAIRTPFYTYTGLLLIIIGLLYAGLHDSYANYMFTRKLIKEFNTNKEALESRLQHLTTKDFVSVQRLGEYFDDTTVYLKVEDVRGDEITVTPVEVARPTEKEYFTGAWKVEDAYTRNAGTLRSVKISYKQLQAAIMKEYPAPVDKQAINRQGVNLLNDGRSYIVRAVVRHYGPIISKRGPGYYGISEFSLEMNNEGWPATIIDIQELEGNGDWLQNLHKEVPGRKLDLGHPAFTLLGSQCKEGDPYKIIMTLKDTTGQLHKYEIAGDDSDYTLREL